MESSPRTVLALAVLIVGLSVSCLMGNQHGGGFIAGNPGVVLFFPIIWGPAALGIVACLVILTWSKGGAPREKIVFQEGEDPRVLLAVMFLTLVIGVAIYVGVMRYSR